LLGHGCLEFTVHSCAVIHERVFASKSVPARAMPSHKGCPGGKSCGATYLLGVAEIRWVGKGRAAVRDHELAVLELEGARPEATADDQDPAAGQPTGLGLLPTANRIVLPAAL
jgi:hypothetical protein